MSCDLPDEKIYHDLFLLSSYIKKFKCCITQIQQIDLYINFYIYTVYIYYIILYFIKSENFFTCFLLIFEIFFR